VTSYIRRRRTLSDAEIFRLYVEEKRDSDTIGAMAECSSTVVLNIVRSLGGIIRPPGGRRSADLLIPVSDIVRRYRDGQSSGPMLAQAAGTTPNTIYKLLREHGVPIRPPIGGGRRKARADG
jgi:hypothetical protein